MSTRRVPPRAPSPLRSKSSAAMIGGRTASPGRFQLPGRRLTVRATDRRSRSSHRLCRGDGGSASSRGTVSATAAHRRASQRATRSSPARARGSRRCVSETRLAGERRPAGQHLVEHAAERPDVGPLVDRLAARLLGAHVGRGAEERPSRVPPIVTVGDFAQIWSGASLPAAALASPKSSTLTTPSGVILMLAGFRSRWTMPLLVRGLERFGDLPRDRQRSRRSAIGPSRDPLGERLALDQLQHERWRALRCPRRRRSAPMCG